MSLTNEQVKEAFLKVKEDITHLREETKILRQSVIEMRDYLTTFCDVLKTISKKTDNLSNEFKKGGVVGKEPSKDLKIENPTHNSYYPPIQHKISTHSSIPTHNLPLEPLKNENIDISTGNEGVPTDRQTDRQTDQQTQNFSKDSFSKENSLHRATEILNSLDSIKKEVRLKFKMLTGKEISVFSTIYQLEEEYGFTDYKVVSVKLGLTESSIRDYVGKLIKKGIPVEKIKVNNKTIHLKISDGLKKIASLSTILQLREL